MNAFVDMIYPEIIDKQSMNSIKLFDLMTKANSNDIYKDFDWQMINQASLKFEQKCNQNFKEQKQDVEIDVIVKSFAYDK